MGGWWESGGLDGVDGAGNGDGRRLGGGGLFKGKTKVKLSEGGEPGERKGRKSKERNFYSSSSPPLRLF